MVELSEADRWRHFGRDWERRLREAGLNGVSWPLDSGGQGRTLLEEIALLEELASANVPESLNFIAKTMLGPTLIRHGNESQRQRFLPAILDGAHMWCQGFSEPDAGSDLANLKTKAVRSDGGWRLFGQKVWTSFASRSDWMFALVRTDREAERHAGLSFVLVDMSTPGIAVRPLRQITGDAEFNEVFFDDVHVPDENVVGQPGEGWKIAGTLLAHERGAAHFGRHIRFRRELERLIELGQTLELDGMPLIEASDYRDRLMALLGKIEIYRLMAYRQVTAMLAGGGAGEGSVIKLFWNSMYQELQGTALDMLGPLAWMADPQRPDLARWPKRFLYSLSRSIAGGTAEIQRNIVAERVLGLPK